MISALWRDRERERERTAPLSLTTHTYPAAPMFWPCWHLSSVPVPRDDLTMPLMTEAAKVGCGHRLAPVGPPICKNTMLDLVTVHSFVTSGVTNSSSKLTY